MDEIKLKALTNEALAQAFYTAMGGEYVRIKSIETRIQFVLHHNIEEKTIEVLYGESDGQRIYGITKLLVLLDDLPYETILTTIYVFMKYYKKLPIDLEEEATTEIGD